MTVKPNMSSSNLLPFFPAGFPDETISSRVSRYHISRGRPTMYVTYKHLFGKPPFSLTGLVQQHLDKLAEKLPGSPQANLVELQNESTLLPLFQQFFGPKTATRHPDRIPGTPLIELPRHIKGDSRLTHICTHCLVADERDYGCPYIHRAHQIPGVTACWKHATRLIDCCPFCECPFAQPNQLILSAWMGCECGYAIADHAQSGQQLASGVEVEFAQFAQALLAAEPSRLSIEQLIDIYKARAIEIGCRWGGEPRQSQNAVWQNRSPFWEGTVFDDRSCVQVWKSRALAQHSLCSLCRRGAADSAFDGRSFSFSRRLALPQSRRRHLAHQTGTR